MQYKGKNRIHWKLQSGEDDYVGLVMHNTRKTPEEPNKHVSEFLVDHTSPGEIPPGEILNRWIQTVTVTYRLSIKSTLPTSATFVYISAVRGKFCKKFGKTVKQYNTQFATKFCWNISETEKARQRQFISAPSVTQLQANCARFRPMTDTQTLQILTRWTK